jgi:Plasmid pRiA4b ORF-3-like protein
LIGYFEPWQQTFPPQIIQGLLTLVQLHRILQRMMGWEGSHLYQFVIGGIAYGDPGMVGEWDAENTRTVTLAALAWGEKSKLLYEYDFGLIIP